MSYTIVTNRTKRDRITCNASKVCPATPLNNMAPFSFEKSRKFNKSHSVFEGKVSDFYVQWWELKLHTIPVWIVSQSKLRAHTPNKAHAGAISVPWTSALEAISAPDCRLQGCAFSWSAFSSSIDPSVHRGHILTLQLTPSYRIKNANESWTGTICAEHI